MPRSRGLGCQTVVEMVTDYLERALTRAVRFRLDEHLRSCPHCAEYLRQVRVMLVSLRRMTAPAPDPSATDEILVHFRRWTAA